MFYLKFQKPLLFHLLFNFFYNKKKLYKKLLFLRFEIKTIMKCFVFSERAEKFVVSNINLMCQIVFSKIHQALEY